MKKINFRLGEKFGILYKIPRTTSTSLPKHPWLVAGAASVSLFGMVAAFGVSAPGDAVSTAAVPVVEELSLANVAPVASTSSAFLREERIEEADTVGSLLNRLGVQDVALLTVLRDTPAAQPIFRQLRPGKSVSARMDEDGRLLSLRFPLNGGERVIMVTRVGNGFSIAEAPVSYETHVLRGSGVIRSSLFAATDESGLPDSVAVQLAEVFAADIDFHRDLRKGDRFSVVYEMAYTNGRPSHPLRILAAEFVNQGKRYGAVWYADDPSGKGGAYYTPEGRNLKKAFLRSPLEFSRVTSGFSMRFHPILQQWRAHKGVDYGAPTGTRVRATGDGVVEFAGKQNGYGNIVVLKHAGKYATAYGHLNGFAPGMRRGARVSQGDIIGYVGATGWATGPHLHYEVRVNDVQVNPLSIALPTSEPLEGSRLGKFRSQTATYTAQLTALRDSVAIALD